MRDDISQAHTIQICKHMEVYCNALLEKIESGTKVKLKNFLDITVAPFCPNARSINLKKKN